MNKEILLLPHQLAFRESKQEIKALVGGFGSGKSVSLVLESIMHSMIDPGLLHLYIAPTNKILRTATLYTFKEVFKDFFGMTEGIDYSWKISSWTFHIPAWNGIITLASGDEPSSLVGANAASCAIEEAALCDVGVWEAANARTRHKHAKHLQIFMASTPEGFNWYYDVCVGDKKPDDFHLVKAKTRDNWHLPKSYIRRLTKMYDPIRLEGYLNGEFVNLTGSVAYYGFDNKNIIKSYTYNPKLPLVVSFDHNYSPNTAVLGQVVNKTFTIFKEYFLENCDTEGKCERIIDDFPGASFEIYTDAAANNRSSHGVGKSDLIIMQNMFKPTRHQIFIETHNPKRIDRLNSVNAKLANGFIQVTTQCKHLIEDFRKIPYSEYVSGGIKDKSLGHISDALGYFIFARYPTLSAGTSRGYSRFE